MEKSEIKKRRRHNSSGSDEEISFAGTAFRGYLTAQAAGLLLLLAASFAAYSRADPEAIAMPLSLAALYIGCTAGGFVCMRLMNDAGAYASALLAAACLNAVTLIVSAATGSSSNPLWLSLLLRGCSFLFAVAGAFLGKRRNSRRKHKKR
ncbi:MAG: hypothetical protein MJ102_00375 [Clostridia bacterium]|nr:hypothetical protein [Clostridia bacterium]